MIFTNGFVNFPVEVKKIVAAQQKLDVPQWLKEFAIFDCIPGCKWSGGRYVKEFYENFNFDVIKELNDLGIGVFPTFTNSVYTNLEDPILLKTLELLAKSPLNGVIVANPILNKFIKENFMSLQRSCSISSSKHSFVNFEDVLKDYDYVCLKQRAYFNKIPSELKYKCEVLCDNACKSDCPYYKKHYELISKALLGEYKPNLKLLNRVCFHKKETVIFDKTWFVENGFTTYKFAMRSYPIGVQVSAIREHLRELNSFYV